MSDQPTHFEPVPLTIEQATHLFKHVCTPSQLADLQDGLDAIIAVLTEVNGLDYYITRQAKSELETLAAAFHTITDEPTVQFESVAYQIVVPSAPPELSDDEAPDPEPASEKHLDALVYVRELREWSVEHPNELVPGDDTQTIFTSPDDDGLSWLDPFRPDAP
ncbi:MAG: hypothetical protein KF716_14250 [Anaerolineae bacterium]|nr:hypothetical protein [Anaerolineae bacterium]